MNDLYDLNNTQNAIPKIYANKTIKNIVSAHCHGIKMLFLYK